MVHKQQVCPIRLRFQHTDRLSKRFQSSLYASTTAVKRSSSTNLPHVIPAHFLETGTALHGLAIRHLSEHFARVHVVITPHRTACAARTIEVHNRSVTGQYEASPLARLLAGPFSHCRWARHTNTFPKHPPLASLQRMLHPGHCFSHSARSSSCVFACAACSAPWTNTIRNTSHY